MIVYQGEVPVPVSQTPLVTLLEIATPILLAGISVIQVVVGSWMKVWAARQEAILARQEVKIDHIYGFTNSALGEQKRLTATALRLLAIQTQSPDDAMAATAAEKLAFEHDAVQKALELEGLAKVEEKAREDKKVSWWWPNFGWFRRKKK